MDLHLFKRDVAPLGIYLVQYGRPQGQGCWFLSLTLIALGTLNGATV
jgi:hypothetical protein